MLKDSFTQLVDLTISETSFVTDSKIWSKPFSSLNGGCRKQLHY